METTAFHCIYSIEISLNDINTIKNLDEPGHAYSFSARFVRYSLLCFSKIMDNFTFYIAPTKWYD